MIIPPPYLLPGFLFAVLLCSFKSQWQALIFMLAVLNATTLSDFFIMVFFTVVSLIVGHFRAAAMS